MKDHGFDESSGAPNMGALPSDGLFQGQQLDPLSLYPDQGISLDPTIQSQTYDAYLQGQVYDPNVAYDPSQSYDPNLGYDPNIAYDPNVAYDPNLGYEQTQAYDPAQAYDPNQPFDPASDPLFFAQQAGADPSQIDQYTGSLQEQRLDVQYAQGTDALNVQPQQYSSDQSVQAVQEAPQIDLSSIPQPTVAFDQQTAQYYDPQTYWVYDVQSGYYINPQDGQAYDSSVYIQSFYPLYYQAQLQQQASQLNGQPAQAGQQTAAADQTSTAEKPKKKSKLRIILIILIGLLLAGAIGIAVYMLWPEDPSKDIIAGNVEGMTLEEIQKSLNDTVEASKFRTSIASVVVFPSPDADGEWNIENSEANAGKLMQVRVIITDSGEQVYETGMIKPGYYIKDAPLDVDLEPGTYKCTANFTAYDEENGAFLGETGTEILLQIKDGSDDEEN